MGVAQSYEHQLFLVARKLTLCVTNAGSNNNADVL